MRRWWLGIALLLSLGVNVGILATLVASGRGGEPARPAVDPRSAAPVRPAEKRPLLPPAAGRRLERLADELGLEGEERERFLDLQRGMFEEGIALARRRGRLQAALRRELLAAEPDRERIEALIAETADAFTRLERTTAAAILDTREMLGPDQERRYLRVVAQIRPRLLRDAAAPGDRPRRRPR